MLYCPQCGAEYREGYTSCADCHVLLGHGRPTVLPKPTEDPFIPFRVAADPVWRDRLTEALKRAEVPHMVLKREDFLFNIRMKVPYTICVRNSFLERAEKVAGDELGTDEEWTAACESGALALPERYVPEESKGVWDPDGWYPEDATTAVWTAEPAGLSDMVELSLRANEIHCRWETRDDKPVLFVLPEDESRAREIIREILEASPPE